MNRARGQILVIRGGAIGDFILTLPVLAALRRQFPDARLALLGYPHIAALALAGGLADEVRPIESGGLALFFAPGRPDLPKPMAAFLGGFNIIISYLYDLGGVFQANVARCSNALFLAGPHRPDESRNLPAAATYLQTLERLAICHADPQPRLDPGPAVDLFAGERGGAASGPRAGDRDLRPILAVHPGSGGDRKNWPEDCWRELLPALLDIAPVRLVLVGGEAEKDRVRRLAAGLPPDRVRLAENRPLPELGRILRGCAGFLGHDSGITHLAAAVGLPGLALWGPTNEQVWRPPHPVITTVRHPDGLSRLPVATVLEHCRRLIPPSPLGGS